MDQEFKAVFKYCPVCGNPSTTVGEFPFRCKCGFVFYFPPATAVGAIISDAQHRVLLIERARDPGRGKLGLPGGFVDPGETAEHAVAREVREEVGLETVTLTFLATFPNLYHYRGIINDILDVFFVCQVGSLDDLQIEPTEVRSYRFAKPDESILDQMAFASNRKALERFVAQLDA